MDLRRKIMKNGLYSVLLLFVVLGRVSGQPGLPLAIPPLSDGMASKFANLALQCISNEYPNSLNYSLLSKEDVLAPKQLNPVFFGCMEWHSSVHGHWLLVKMLEIFPEIKNREVIIQTLNQNLTREKINVELEFINRDDRVIFERPYGWAWLLKLASELAASDQEHTKEWEQALRPLTLKIKEKFYSYLPSLYYPVRRGVHENTAFAIAMALDYARTVGDKTFESFLIERAKFYYMNDKNIPASWEPEGDDFFSPSLIEADLMRRVLTRGEFIQWFKSYMPDIPFGLQHPVVVANRTDPKGMQLDGLNLSRAWCMFELAKVMPDDSQTHRDLWQSGYRHAAEALPNVLSDNYYGTHWLATFALFMYLSLSGIEP
jgi:hypothetical protein